MQEHEPVTLRERTQGPGPWEHISKLGQYKDSELGKHKHLGGNTKSQELGSQNFLGRKHRDIGAANRLSITFREHKVKGKTRTLALGTHRHSGRIRILVL